MFPCLTVFCCPPTVCFHLHVCFVEVFLISVEWVMTPIAHEDNVTVFPGDGHFWSSLNTSLS